MRKQLIIKYNWQNYEMKSLFLTVKNMQKKCTIENVVVYINK